MFEFFTEEARRAVAQAYHHALSAGAPQIEPRHLAVAVLCEYPAMVDSLLRSTGQCTCDLLRILGADQAQAQMRQAPRHGLPLSRETRTAIKEASRAATRYAHDWVGIEHLLVGLFSPRQGAALWLVRAQAREPILGDNCVRADVLEATIGRLREPFGEQARLRRVGQSN